ncbi:MAG: hypothetical protein U9R47_09260, partial [Actinomycetota bacterium]|nr:hypothetical protein [Actinomycetota bacterium]
MSNLTRDYGSEINELLASLGRITVPAHANADWTKIRNLQRRLNGKTVLMQTVARRRAALVEDRRWAESDIHGFERALVLVGGTGDAGGTVIGGNRLQQRLDARVSCVDELTIEIEAIDERIRQIETEIVSAQQVLVVVLGQSIDNAEE